MFNVYHGKKTIIKVSERMEDNMKQKTIDLFKELTQLIGVSGNEKEVSRYLKKSYTGLCDEIIYDNLGSIFALKKSKKKNAKRVMLCAHMDEVGLLITEIHENGLASFIKLGPIADQALYAQQVRIQTRDGKEIPAVVTAEEDGVKKADIKKMFLDFGAASKEEALNLGVYTGDNAVLQGDFTLLANDKRIMSKAADTRFGLVLGIELLESLKGHDLDFDLYVGASVMEEVGQRGGTTATGLIEPDLGIVIDGGTADDLSGKENAVGQLGKGLLIRYYDKGMMPNRGLLNELSEVCKTYKIDSQYYYDMNLTDAAWVHKLFAGCPVLQIGICARNSHTSLPLIDLHDYECAKTATIHIIESLDEKKIQYFKEYNR